MKEEIMELKKELREVQEAEGTKSLAREMLGDMRKRNERQHQEIVLLIVLYFLTVIASGIYVAYLHNDIGVIEEREIIDIDDVETIDESDIQIGDK